MASTDNQFSEKIKAWLSYELKSLELKEQINKLNTVKEDLEKQLTTYIKSNNMQKTAINLPNSRICYFEEIQYNNISLTFLRECLSLYFNNDHTKAEQICDFIRTKRLKVRKPGLKILPKKK
jgi:hypothetical protein